MNKKIFASQILILIGILAFWQLAPTFDIISKFIVGPFSQVIASYPQLNQKNSIYVPLGGILPNLYLTIEEIVVGYVLSIAIGLIVGFLIGYYKRFGDAYEPFVYVIHAVPGVILYPILYLTFGVGFGSKIAFGVLLGAFPLIINTAAGLRQIKAGYVRLARSFGATDRQLFWKVLLPASGPNIMSGLRLSLAGVIIATIAGEVLVSKAGLGRVIDNAAALLKIDQMWAAILLVVLIALVLYLVIIRIERWVLPYERH